MAARISKWELAALLGLCPHQLGRFQYLELTDLTHIPVSAAAELARVIEMPLLELIARINHYLAEGQPAIGDALARARTVMSALAYTPFPVTAAIAEALDWPLPDVEDALAQALAHPETASVHIL